MIVLLIGFLAMLVCLALQATATVVAVRYYGRTATLTSQRRPGVEVFLELSVLMIVLMLGTVIQIAIWALLYRLLGKLGDMETAMYFSGVTFTSLGYGDVLLEGRARLLAPLQAANGLMMFGISTALFIAAVQRAIADTVARRSQPAPQ